MDSINQADRQQLDIPTSDKCHDEAGQVDTLSPLFLRLRRRGEVDTRRSRQWDDCATNTSLANAYLPELSESNELVNSLILAVRVTLRVSSNQVVILGKAK